ncbi:IS3 family transposase [Chloroflexota bacterium]
MKEIPTKPSTLELSLKAPNALDESLVRSISEVRQGYAEVYGYRKVTMALRAAGRTVNAEKALRHLRSLGRSQSCVNKGQL